MAAPVIAPRKPSPARKPAATPRSQRNERALAKARATQSARPPPQTPPPGGRPAPPPPPRGKKSPPPRARAPRGPRPATAPRPRPAPAPARRKSGAAAKPRTRPAQSPVARVLNSRGMPLLDRILRGPAWVVMLGALLAGIVFLNVSVLELNRGIASTDTKSAQLERVNSALRARVAKLDSGERIQELAAARGFVMPQPADVIYVRERASNASLAAQRITPPTPPTTTTSTTPTPTPTPTTTTP